MALMKDIDFRGILVSDAYIRVSSVNIDRGHMQFRVTHHVDANSEELDSRVMECDYIDGVSPFKQAYDLLKTLPIYERSINV